LVHGLPRDAEQVRHLRCFKGAACLFEKLLLGPHASQDGLRHGIGFPDCGFVRRLPGEEAGEAPDIRRGLESLLDFVRGRALGQSAKSALGPNKKRLP
jgi:hypothetical protein